MLATFFTRRGYSVAKCRATLHAIFDETYDGRHLGQRLNLNVRFDWLSAEICVNVEDGGFTKKFVARDVAEEGRNSTAAILRATILGVDTRCNLAIAGNRPFPNYL